MCSRLGEIGDSHLFPYFPAGGLFVDELAGVVVEDVFHLVLFDVGEHYAPRGHHRIEPGIIGAEQDFLGACFAAHPFDDPVHVIGGGEFEVDVRELGGKPDGFLPRAVTGVPEDKADIRVLFGDLAHVVCAAPAIGAPRVRQDHPPLAIGAFPYGPIVLSIDGIVVRVGMDLDANDARDAKIRVHFGLDVLDEVGIDGAVSIDALRIATDGIEHLDVALAGIARQGVVRGEDDALDVAAIHARHHFLKRRFGHEDSAERPKMSVGVDHGAAAAVYEEITQRHCRVSGLGFRVSGCRIYSDGLPALRTSHFPPRTSHFAPRTLHLALHTSHFTLRTCLTMRSSLLAVQGFHGRWPDGLPR